MKSPLEGRLQTSQNSAMVFDPALFQAEPGDLLFQDRYREVEVGLSFRKAECYGCGFIGFYKFQSLHVRRNEEILSSGSEAIRPDHMDLWKSIPRYAEIPQTVKCRRCGEVMGFYTSCIF